MQLRTPSHAPDAPVAPAWPPVSLVMPVLNEGAHLREAVGQILAQDYPGELEVVLALGPSRDDTDAVAGRLSAADPRVRTVRNPSGRTPSALNAAVAASRHPIVARVDGHAMIPRDYLRSAVEVLLQTGADNVGGIMAAEGDRPFSCAVARAMTSRLGVGSARFHTGGEAGPALTVYLGVFRRSALERAGGYDESFLRAQDWELNHRIRATGGLVYFTPRLRVSYRPRASLRALARQYFDYGRWRRAVMRRHTETVSLRYLAPPAALVGVTGGTVAGLLGQRKAYVLPAGYAALVAVGAAVTGRDLPPPARARLPLVYATMHLAWGLGFLTSPPRLGPVRRAARARVGWLIAGLLTRRLL
ncbi:MAG: glycosyltransferase family 2 protein [Actinomycetota bacterium]|nr:glycosyltransferase family 2 protein [Actinomycetota bacterium]